MLHVTVLLKHWSFRYMSTIAVVVGAGLIAFVARTASSLDWKLVVTTVSVGLSLIYFVQKQKLEEVHLFNGLFEKFNQRYDRLNERLAEIDNVDSEIGLTNEEKAILVDYFNLCGKSTSITSSDTSTLKSGTHGSGGCSSTTAINASVSIGRKN